MKQKEHQSCRNENQAVKRRHGVFIAAAAAAKNFLDGAVMTEETTGTLTGCWCSAASGESSKTSHKSSGNIVFQHAANEAALTLIQTKKAGASLGLSARKTPGCWNIEHGALPEMKQGSSLFVNTTSESEYRSVSDIIRMNK